MTANIVWIASYPKSGNTWFRAFISNLLTTAETPVHINTDMAGIHGDSRLIFDDCTGIDSVNLLPEEVDGLRPEFYKTMSASSSDTLFIKTHDAYQYLPNGQAFFPSEATRCAIYITRNPLDIVPSFAHFMAKNFDESIAFMNDPGHTLNRERRNVTQQLSQKVMGWSENVLSWLDAPVGMKVHVMRYEDMLRNPEETFGLAVQAIGWDKDKKEIRRAIANSSFGVLRKMEEEHGFQEKPPMAARFFREGIAGAWHNHLSCEQVAAVVEKNKVVMQRLGYLDANDNIVDA